MSAFALAALALATTGIYAVVMYSVSQRGREFAIRSVLGARPRDLLVLVVRLVAVIACLVPGLRAASSSMVR